MLSQRQPLVERWSEAKIREWLWTWDYDRLVLAKCTIGFPMVERFDWQGGPLEPGFRRVRVLGRQAYVLCHLAIGGNITARALAPLAIEALLVHAIGPDGQFRSRLSADYTVIDDTADLYDIAFGLFAIAWWYRLSGDENAIDVAENSLNNIRERMASSSGRGFVARVGEPGLHHQNPHMHLFEAALFLSAFCQKPLFRILADELFELVDEVMFDPKTGTLSEFFDENWRPCGAEPNGPVRIEPGHHYEWVWLLNRYGQHTGQTRAYGIADRLFAFAGSHGHDQRTGLVLDAVTTGGRPLARDLRLWPNTELLKAQISMRERHGSSPGIDDTSFDQTIANILNYFLTRHANGPAAELADGLWIDYLEHDGTTPKSDHVPASSLYHIVFAFTELLRHRAGHEPFSGQPW